MFQPKLRRVLVSAVLVSALSLPAHAAAPRQRPQQTRSERNAAVRFVVPFWDLLNNLLGKSGIRIDPDGNRVAVQSDSDGNAPGGRSNSPQ